MNLKSFVSPYRLTVLLAILLFIVSCMFCLGYALGLNDSKITDPLTLGSVPTITPVSFVAQFNPTPVPPDESSWEKFTEQMHYHTFTISLPPDYSQEATSPGIYTFQDTSDDTVTFSTDSSYAPITKHNYETDNFRGNASETIKGGTKMETFNLDFLTEDMRVVFTGPLVTYFYANTILDTMNIGFLTPESPTIDTSIFTNIATIAYPTSYIADTLFANTTNCNNSPESIIHLKFLTYIIDIDIGKCLDTKTSPILNAEKQTLNGKQYIRVEYSDHSYCYLSAETKSISALILFPLKDWTFAPKDSLIDGQNGRICLMGDTSKTSRTNQKAMLNDLQYIVQNISVGQNQ